MIRLLRLPLILVAVLLAAACGQKGDLYLPGPPPTSAAQPLDE